MPAKRPQTWAAAPPLPSQGSCGKTLSCTRISSATPGCSVRLSQQPLVHWDTANPLHPLPGELACLPGKRGCCLARTTVLLPRLQSLPQAPRAAPCTPHLCWGNAEGHQGCWGSAGAAGRERGLRAGPSRARQRGAKPPGKAWIRACPRVLSCSHKAPRAQAGSAPSAAFSLCGQGWCQRRNLLISSSSSRSLPQASQPPFPPSRLDCRPSAAEPAGAGMCESHVSLLQTVGKCCSSELTAAALPQPQPRPWPRNRSWAGRPGTPVHSRSAPLSVGPLPAPSPAGDKEHLSPQRLPQPPRVVKEGLLTWFSFRNSCSPALLCFFFFRR